MACARHVVQRVFSARTREVKVSFTIRHVLLLYKATQRYMVSESGWNSRFRFGYLTTSFERQP